MEFNIGDRISDDKRDITIIKKERIKGRLYYKYKCNICGYDCEKSYRDGVFKDEYWVIGSHLTSNKVGCSCCQGRAVVPGINNIGHTAPNIAKYIRNEIDKLRYTKSSKKKVEFECPICHAVFLKNIDNVYSNGFSCPVCSDGMSLGEKIVYWLLRNINVDFIKEYSSGVSNWTGRYRYDFYINPNIIIEVMGIQHYEDTQFKRTLECEQRNDANKEKLAKENGIMEYIKIDSSKTDFEFIKNNILHSKLKDLFDLSNVNWEYIKEKSLCSSLVKDICDNWANNLNITTGELKDMYHLSYNAIQRYLKLGNEIGLCKYNSKEYRRRNIYNNDTVNISKPIRCIENNKYFKSAGLCARKSIEAFGIQLNEPSIRSVLHGKYSHHRNYHFEYVTKQAFNNAIKSNYECYGSPYKI